MARKSKRVRKETKSGPRELDPNDAKIGKLTSYEDVANSEDEFYLNQDKIAFDEDPATKRRRLNRDPVFDDSDEEVIGLEELPSSEDEEDSDEEDLKGATKGLSLSDDDDDDEEEEEEDEYADWGASKKNFYDANVIENEEDAALEEAEARRIQQKQLQSMSAADFGLDEDDWKQGDTTAPEERQDESISTAGNTYLKKTIKIPDSDEDKLDLLRLLHPEFAHLRQEYIRLAPLHKGIEEKGKSRTDDSSIARKRWIILTAYLGVLSLYFALLTQPRPAGETVDLRDHGIMDALLEWRTKWLEVEGIDDEDTDDSEELSEEEEEEMEEEEDQEEEDMEIDLPKEKPVLAKSLTNGVKGTKLVNGTKEKTKPPKKSSVSAKEARRLAKADASLKDLDDLIPSTKAQKASKSKALVQFKDDDFGEEDFIYEEDAEDKAKRKKSLKFYTAQIHQKSNKRGRAGRDAGGDMDVPHKERNKEKQEKLNAEAQKRGMGGGLGSDLDDDDDYDNDLTDARMLKSQIEADNTTEGDALDYYNEVASKSKLEKLRKKLEHEASQTQDRVVETETVDPVTGKRAIGYTIEKNKGLTPHRKKDVRNPRVKKRKKFEAAKKKLGSKKAVYKPPTSAYSGETTGIRTKVIKSVKFS